MSQAAVPLPDGRQPDCRAERRSRRSKTLCLLGLIGAALGLSTSWLSLQNLLFDALSHFTLHYVIAAFAFLVGYFMPRTRLLTAAVIILAGIAGIAWWPQKVSQDPAPAAELVKGEQKLRLMTYNTWLSNKDWRAVRDEIRRHDPDIVTLLEFGKEKARAFQDLKKDYPYSVHCIQKAYCHMAIISKHPLYDVETRDIWKGPAFIRARLGKKFGRIYVYGLHSTRPPHVRSQIKQLQAMARRLHGVKGSKIVMGDFNSTPFARLLKQFGDHNDLIRITYLPTWPARWGPFPQLSIDHIFLSPGMRKLNDAWIGRPSGSDHYPMVVDVAVDVGR